MKNQNSNCLPLGNLPIAAFLGPVLAVIGLADSFAAESPARPTAVSVVTTNWSPRWITNVIQVSIPTNLFRDEYRTNWVEHRVTNTLDVFKTNVVSVDDFHTNLVVAYRTNLKSLTFTNWVPVLVMRTNFVTQPVTNIVEFTNTVIAETTLTNRVTAYQTNLRAFTLTNWETVLVMKTNWVTRPITNVVEIDLPAPAAAVTASPATAKPVAPVPAGTTTVAATVDVTQSLEFELTHTANAAKPDQYPIRLILKSPGEATAILPVQEWRVEKVGGGAFMVGSRAEFTAVLPSGEYKITARVRANDGTTKNIRGNTEVKADASAVRSSASATATR